MFDVHRRGDLRWYTIVVPNNDEPIIKSNVRSSSTIFLGDEPKMSRHPQGDRRRGEASAVPVKRKQRRSLTAPVQVVMSIRLGAEPEVILRGSGVVWRYPADRALYDVVRHFNWLLDQRR